MFSYQNITNPVGKLQERMMSVKGGSLPRYQLTRVEGASHCPTFTLEVTLGDLVCQGVGNSKKAAKDEAARRMLEKLDSANPRKSEATGSAVSSETFTEDDIRPSARPSVERERVVQCEAAPVLTEEDVDLERLQDQFREFTEFLKWKKRGQENDLKTEEKNPRVVEKRATVTEVTNQTEQLKDP